MSTRVPVHIQPISEQIQHLPQAFNTNEYDSLSALNLPMNESGLILPGETQQIKLGYRILIPHGFVGIMKERMSAIKETPFKVLAGTIDSNAMRKDTELHDVNDLGTALDLQNDNLVEPVRFHPELILFVYNCGTKPLVFTKGKAIVQLFILPICESQVRILQCGEQTTTGVPLRYDRSVSSASSLSS